MIYNKVSVESVISRILRNTKITDMTTANDIYEWILEASDRFNLRKDLPKVYKELEVSCHTALVPCELVCLDAILYKGERLRRGSSQITVDKNIKNLLSNNADTYFYTETTDIPADQNAQNYSLARGFNLKEATAIALKDFYYTEGNAIKTSFEEGSITIFYRVRNLDKNGLPFIPDIEEVKQYCFWYVAGQLCMTGFKFSDASINYDYCDNKATKCLKEAKKIIRTPSYDQKEEELQMWVGLVPPRFYYQNFFLNGEQIERTGLPQKW